MANGGFDSTVALRVSIQSGFSAYRIHNCMLGTKPKRIVPHVNVGHPSSLPSLKMKKKKTKNDGKTTFNQQLCELSCTLASHKIEGVR